MGFRDEIDKSVHLTELRNNNQIALKATEEWLVLDSIKEELADEKDINQFLKQKNLHTV